MLHGAMTLTLPLVSEELPEALRRFCDVQAPERTRQVAAKGLVPVKGAELVAVLLQLMHDPVQAIADSARATFEAAPAAVIEAACDAPLHPAFLEALVRKVAGKDDLIERILLNPALALETVAIIARSCSERIAERVALNEERVLQMPLIIEALYKNRATRMSTVDRLIDLAVRHGVTLDGIHTFEAHALAIQGQLIPEPTDEPLPSDLSFNQALDLDGIEEALSVDAEEGTEDVKEKYKPLVFKIQSMSFADKLRLCVAGNAGARGLLVRDPNKIVAMNAVSSPQMTENEATGIANSRQVSEEVLRFVGNKREWMGNYEIKRSLVFNPKTPVALSMKYLAHLQVADLRTLSRSRGIPTALKQLALQRVAKKGS